MDIPSTIQSLAHGRQKIDMEILEEIQRGNEAVRKLKTRRNTLAYISRLPTEIISGIFIILAYSCLDHSDLSWISSATAVCGRWRAIALECPNIWSVVDFSRPIWVEEMLKRSKMAPLIIRADGPFSLRDDQIDAVRLSLQHISRIKELRLAAPMPTIANFIDPIDNPAPLLRSLHLQVINYGYWNDTYTLPETFFVCGGRRLHRLELINCSILWESPLLCGLIHFKFKLFGTEITDTLFLDVLEKMPLLETLDLEGLLPDPSGDTKRSVHLSHLTSLRLSYTAPDGMYLLELISFPASTSLTLICQFTWETDYSTTCDAISSVWNGKEDSQLLRCLVIDCLSEGTEDYGDGLPARVQIDYPLGLPKSTLIYYGLV